MANGGNGGAQRSTVALVAYVAIAATVVTVAVGALPFTRFAYEAPTLHVVLETVNAVVALLVGYLVYGRFRQSRHLQDLLLGLALGTVAVASFVLTAVPSAVVPGTADPLSSWAPLGVRLLGTVTFALAALTPAGRRVSPQRAGATAAAYLAAVLAVGAVGTVWGGVLPPAVDPATLGDASRPVLIAHPAVLGVQALGALLYGVAAVAFARQADRRHDQLLRWLAAGCVLSAFARVHYLLFPSLYSDYVYTGDLLRLGFYVLLLVGAAKEITSYWTAQAEAAVLEDRRRVARDLHDGVIQELSYIWSQSRRLAADPGDVAVVERIGGAAGRAIEESRRTLAALTRPEDEHLPTALQRAAEEMAERYDVKVVTEIDPTTDVDAPLADALLRITGEAVHNAVRHGAPSRIHVQLTADPLALCVHDDGRGFPVDRPDGGRPGGFGLTSMRERAEGVGGTLAIESEPGEGTTVRVTWA